MNSRKVLTVLSAIAVVLTSAISVGAQDFDFKRLDSKIKDYTLIVDLKIEVSFGMHSSEQSERLLGTLVSDDGLVIFNGAPLSSDAAISTFAGVTVKTSPSRIEITDLNDKTYEGEYIGVDRFTKIGFLRIKDYDGGLKPVSFVETKAFVVGDWLALYMLLPDFVTPPLGADVGMISTVVSSPEFFPLTVGFNSLQVTSVLYNHDLQPVGVLGSLLDPSDASTDQSGMIESFQQFGIPLLGVITSERLKKMIADPPKQGEVDRGWMGITLQALTKELAEFWTLEIASGIIVNDIVAGSPAEQGGLQTGDIIYQVNGDPVEVDKDEEIPIFQRRISELGPGASVELAVKRPTDAGFDDLRLLITLAEAPMTATDAADYESEKLEFKVRNMVFGDYMFNRLDPESFSGVVVSEIKPGGLADIGGLQLGDIIQSLDNRPIGSIEEAEAVLATLDETRPDEAVFFVWRNNKTLFVNVKIDWE